MRVPAISHSRRMSVPPLLLGAVLSGTLDLVFATSFWGLKGVSPVVVLQSIASGLIGRSAFHGGAKTAVLGLALHFGIATGMVLAYALGSLCWPVLRHQTWSCGVLYGLLLYAVMNGIVVPLSAATTPPFHIDAWFIGNLLSHCLLVGIPCALATRMATARMPPCKVAIHD